MWRWSTEFGDVPEVLPTKQPFWDRPGVLADKALVEGSLNSSLSSVLSRGLFPTQRRLAFCFAHCFVRAETR